MESLIVFLIFIVFSILRSLGESNRQRQGRYPLPGPPQRPGRPPLPREHPLPPTRRQPAMVEVPREPAAKKAVRVVVPEESRVVIPVQAEPVKKEKKEDVPGQAAAQEEIPAFNLDANSVLLGIVFSELLGEPRARKKQLPYRRSVL